MRLMAGMLLLAAMPTPVMAEEAGRALAPELEAAAEALGMVRGFERSTNLLNTVQYRASGVETSANAAGAATKRKIAKAVVGYSYAVPGGRIDFQYAGTRGPAERVIRVVAGTKAWNETTPGSGFSPSADAARRLADVWITPHGAIRAAVDADPAQVSISKEGDKTVVITPAGGLRLRIVLDAKNMPEQVSTQLNDPDSGPTTIEANYTGYKDWDGYDVPFPSRLVHRVNGRTTLDLRVTEFRSNPYVVFPDPAIASAPG